MAPATFFDFNNLEINICLIFLFGISMDFLDVQYYAILLWNVNCKKHRIKNLKHEYFFKNNKIDVQSCLYLCISFFLKLTFFSPVNQKQFLKRLYTKYIKQLHSEYITCHIFVPVISGVGLFFFLFTCLLSFIFEFLSITCSFSSFYLWAYLIIYYSYKL